MTHSAIETSSRTVLVIDDDFAVQQFAAKALARVGYQVLVAADMQEALNVAADHPSKIDLALIDVMLPSGSGIELATALLTKRRDALVLYMSGFPADAIQAVQHVGGPAGGFLEKPFSAQALVRRINEILPISLDRNIPLPSSEPRTPDVPPEQTATMANADAIYGLETPVTCPQCRETVSTLKAIRLLRTQVNFTSTLPRRGRILACPRCLCLVSAELTNF